MKHHLINISKPIKTIFFLQIVLFSVPSLCNENNRNSISKNEIKNIRKEMQFLKDWASKKVPDLNAKLSDSDNALLDSLSNNETSTQQVIDSVSNTQAAPVKKSKKVEKAKPKFRSRSL